MPIVKIDSMKKIYNADTPNPVSALNDISMSIDEGEMIAIIGTSGSGKSTLLHIMAGIDTVYDGVYELCSVNMGNLTRSEVAKIRNKRIGIVLQNFGLLSDLTVFDNVALPLYLSNERVSKKQIKEKVETILIEVGLESKINTKVQQLSGGQKQRVAISRAIINNPQLLLADEPTGALDQKTTIDIMNLFVELNKKGQTIIIVTHDMEVAKMCNRIIRISDGRIDNMCSNN